MLQTQTALAERISQETGVPVEQVKRIMAHVSATNGGVDESSPLSYRHLVQKSIEMLREARSTYQGSMTPEFVPPYFPSHVQIQTVGGCNASCVMCSMSSAPIRRMQRGQMTASLFAKIVEECAGQSNCEEIALYLQNEPLLDTDLANKIRWVKKVSANRLFTRIVTNGSLLFQDRIAELIEAGLDRVSISLNAFTPATYHKVMGGLNLDQTLSNIEHLLQVAPTGMLVTLTFMITAINQHEIHDAISYWSRRGVLCGAYGINTMSGTVPDFESVRGHLTRRTAKECYLPLESAAILCSGDVLLCCTDWARLSVCGNLQTRSLFDVWHSNPLAELRRNAIYNRFEHEICQKCLGQTRVLENLLSREP